MGVDVLEKIESDPQFKHVSERMKKAQEISKLTGAIHTDNVNNPNTYFSEERKFYIDYTNYLFTKYEANKSIIEDLVSKYGMNAVKILDLNSKIKDKEKYILFEENICPILKAELVYCIKYEMVTKPNDFLCRRNGIAFVNYDKSVEILEKVTEILGSELRWSRERIKSEKLEALINLKYFI